MRLKSKFDIEDIVCLKTDSEKKERMVTAICFKTSGVEYELKRADQATWHFEFEFEAIPVRAKISGFLNTGSHE